jgi:hypothetical protein
VKTKLLVLDWDGTFTNAEEEGISFCDGYYKDLLCLIGVDKVVFDAQLETAKRAIEAAPQMYGWVDDGKIVAPALLDPYQYMKALAALVLDAFGRFVNPEDRERVLDFLFQLNRPKSKTVFKPEAADAMVAISKEGLANGFSAVIVTNSSKVTVQNKLDELFVQYRLKNDDARCTAILDMLSRVVGHARKNKLGDSPSDVPEKFDLPCLGRPVYLRRSSYFETLDRLRGAQGIGWSEMAVVGDSLEMDLMLPFVLGARIGLVVNPNTPRYEIDFAEANAPQARIITDMRDVAKFFAY